MNKVRLIEKIAEKVSINKKQVEQTIDSLLEIITAELKSGKAVTLVGFGSFIPKKRHARGGVNPQKPQERINIPEVTVAKFKTGKALKDALKNQR
ncbi:HU family DNA-binding protein [Candidatus Falkowbacteria bacterium]|nr:HU family DNA-binding protein [Candidatus Falkowbacteria bacterium]